MAVRTAVCAVAGREWSHNGSFTAEYAQGAGYAGYNGVYYYVYILKFTTPEFSGRGKSVSVSLPCSELTGSEAVLRWALCSSDANSGSYAYAYGEVADDSRIAMDTLKLSGLTSDAVNTELALEAALEPGTEYYLYLWAAADDSGDTGGAVQLGDSENIAVTLGYLAGSVLVQTSEGIKTAYVDVYQNGKWHENCIPEAYLDGTWKTCG